MPKMARPDAENIPLLGNSITSKTAKYIAYVFFPISYITLLILASILKSYIEEWSSLTHANLIVVTSLLISAGVFGILFSYSLAACDESDKCGMIIWYSFVMTLQVSAIVYGFLQVADKNNYLKKTIEADMRNNFNLYSVDIKSAFDGLQMEESCCGVHGVKDYTQLSRKIPISCCQVTDNMDKYCTDPSLVYKDGCASKMYDSIINNVRILSYFSSGLIILQIVLGIMSYVTKFR